MFTGCGEGICKERKPRRNSEARRSVTRTMSPRRKKNKSHGENHGFVTGRGEGICKERKPRRNSEQGEASHGQYPLAARKTKAMVKTMALSLVAGRGFEPPDLWVMSPTSYRTAPPRDQAPLKVLDYHNIFCAVCQVNFQNFCKFQRKLAFCWGSVLQYAHESV